MSAHTEATAINRLKSTAYFQWNHSVDAYLDEFIDLIVEAGYTDAKKVVIKFCKGLDPQIQNVIATIVRGHLRASASPTEYVHPTAPDKLRLEDTLYIPPHRRQRPHLPSSIASPFQTPLTD